MSIRVKVDMVTAFLIKVEVDMTRREQLTRLDTEPGREKVSEGRNLADFGKCDRHLKVTDSWKLS